MEKRRYYIETYGCEMNKSDSVDISLAFEECGYERARSEEDADVIVLNTCAVRENAEDRILGRLGHFRSLRRRGKTGAVLVLAGCVAQERGAELSRTFPEIGVVSGTSHVLDIPLHVEAARSGGGPFVAIEEEGYRFSPYRENRAEGYKAWVNIIKGCSNYCSYCIVPYLRGPEISKPSGEVLAEVEALAGRGVVEITLLGQNVNAFGRDSGDIGFIELLERLERERSRNAGVRWIRFLTSHPKDFTREVIRRISKLDRVCKHFHLPIQSGSDRILSLMNRGYSVGHYMELIDEIRSALPRASVTTDLIVGFPQETEEDFRRTLDLVRTVNFDDAFTYRYSERAFTGASRLPGKIDPCVSGKRLEELIALQRSLSLERSREEIGARRRVLVERPSKKDGSEYLCKTEGGKMVIVRTGEKAGRFIEVEITGISGNTLRGVEIASAQC
jgi:tRNA-2-methylthio-N6-dimethylallyladenosine synthase